MQPIPNISRADVERVVRRDFPAERFTEIMALLDEYGLEGWHREPERVRIGILRLAEGDLAKLRQHLQNAKQDYRDILAFAEYPAYFADPYIQSLRETERQKIIEQDRKQYQDWLNR